MVYNTHNLVNDWGDYMNEDVTKITDVIHGTIYLSEIEKEIISTPLFNRLHYVSQTSTILYH